jgi:hypothetical protein
MPRCSRSSRKSRNRSCSRSVSFAPSSVLTNRPRSSLFQPACRLRVACHLLAACGAEFRQDRATQQEQPQFGQHVLQHLGGQVAEDMPVQRRRAQRGRGRPAIGQRVQRQAQSHCPAVSARHQLRRADACCGRQCGLQRRLDLAGVELQVALAELGQLALHAQPSQHQGRRLAAGQHQRRLRRQAGQQQVQKLEQLRVADPMQIVEDDHTAWQLAGHQRVEQLVGGLAALAARAGRACTQSIGVGTPGRVERLERRAQAGQQRAAGRRPRRS